MIEGSERNDATEHGLDARHVPKRLTPLSRHLSGIIGKTSAAALCARARAQLASALL